MGKNNLNHSDVTRIHNSKTSQPHISILKDMQKFKKPVPSRAVSCFKYGKLKRSVIADNDL